MACSDCIAYARFPSDAAASHVQLYGKRNPVYLQDEDEAQELTKTQLTESSAAVSARYTTACDQLQEFTERLADVEEELTAQHQTFSNVQQETQNLQEAFSNSVGPDTKLQGVASQLLHSVLGLEQDKANLQVSCDLPM